MSDEQDKRQNSEDSFEENLRQILSNNSEPSTQKNAAPKPRTVSKTRIENTEPAPKPEQKYIFWFALIRVAAFATVIGLLALFVCRTIG